MFQKAIDTVNKALESFGLTAPPVKAGLVIDTLSRESFPARPEIGASLDVDTSTFRMAIGMGPGQIPLNPSWQLRVRQPDGETRTYWMSEETRARLLEDLRDQVAKNGRVIEIQLPHRFRSPKPETSA